MTRITGVRILVAPCCGKAYSAPLYASMNFSAWEYWTDGWREGSLMPNDQGLRRCKCGRFLLLGDLVQVDTAKDSSLPWVDRVKPDDLGECFAQGGPPACEMAARLMLWHHLNHPYRDLYRAHRDREDAAHSVWEVVRITREPPPDRRGWFSRLIGVKPLQVQPHEQTRRRADAPFTTPPFEPSPEAIDNLERLFDLMKREDELSVGGVVLMAEVARELGRFEEAEEALPRDAPQFDGVTWKLISDLIEERRREPMRYRC